MSPFQNADKIKKPLLLIHGADDNNSGTFPLQASKASFMCMRVRLCGSAILDFVQYEMQLLCWPPSSRATELG